VSAICVAFWTVDAREAANAFTYGGQTFAQYPLGIYDRWMRRFLAYVVPLGFVAYFPALYVLGKPDPLGLPSGLGLLSPLVALAAAGVTFVVWQSAVRHYRSAGG
jgi:ABC-2 type transport system permease protein